METAAVLVIQKCLVKEGINPGPIDGDFGDLTSGAVGKALTKRTPPLPGDWQGWPASRQAVAYLQQLCQESGIDSGDIDGFWGPQTDYAFGALTHLLETGVLPPPWRDDTPLNVNPNGWPPQNEPALNEFYGKVGTNQVSLALPYPHRVSWDLSETITSYQCNAKVRDSAKRVLQRVFEHYGIEKIKELRLDRWGGCLNVRQMRGGTHYSMHSWGIAIDYDPDNNQLTWGRDHASFARPDYAAWWRFWEEEGWTSLGRSKNYDWMHVQATRL
jgi:hypothetical protein